MTTPISPERSPNEEGASRLFAPALDVLGALPWPSPEGAPQVPFASSRWQLHHVSTWPAYSPRADFVWDSIENPAWRLSAKEVALCLMQPTFALEHRLPLARRKAYPPWALPYQRLSYWRRWFTYLTANGHTSLATVTQATCESFLATITPDSRHIAISAIRVFADYGPLLTHGGYVDGFRPWGRASAASASGQASLGEANNKTPVIPDRVFAPLLAGALFLVEEVGPQLIEASDEMARLESLRSPRGGVAINVDERLDAYIARLRTEGRAVPGDAGVNGTGPRASTMKIAVNLGLAEHRVLRRPDRWAKLLAAVDELGVGPDMLLAGGPHILDNGDLRRMTRLVRTACFIVVAAVSGLRSSELAAIERGACRREVIGWGIVRYRVDSLLLKGEPPGGKRDTWTVIEPVADALHLAERLAVQARPLRITQFSTTYRELRDWVNGLNEDLNVHPIPTDWDLEPRQFRRTLARELAWRPNGVIAGKIHLKHISVATTEGYAGRRGESGAAFMAEVEAERREATREEARTVFEAVDRGEPIAGMGAKALAAAVASLPDQSTDGPQVRDREEALTALVRSRSNVLHPTPLVHCWFTDPERARCLRGATDKSRPLVGSCEPSRCANATIHPQHVPIWLSGIETLRATLSDRRVPAGERDRLNAKIDEMQSAIEPITRSQQ